MKAKYLLSQDDNLFLAKRILVDSVYESANLEGIGVTFAETTDILNNVNVARLRPDEITAILNLRDAWHYVIDTLDTDLDLGFIKECHVKIAHGLVVPLGEFRTTLVAISGTKWRPDEPDTERCHSMLMKLKEIINPFERSIEIMLWIMRSQMFKDGNKRVATVVANHEMIKNGCGIIHIPIELDGVFKTKLVQFYETDNSQDLKNFIYENCIEGIEFEKETEKTSISELEDENELEI